MSTYWASHAWLPDGVATDVRLTVGGGVFTAVETAARPQPTDLRLPGIVLPGLANTHSHAFHRALRGRTHAGSGTGTFWTWREQMYAVAERLDPDTYLALATATYAEMALAGYTAVAEFHYVHHQVGGRPYDNPNAMGEALVEAAACAGIRLTLLDTAYLAGGLDADGHHGLAALQARFGDADIDAWAARVGARRPLDASAPPTWGVAIHSVRAVPREVLARVAAAGGGGPVHAHVSEQVAENDACAQYYGVTPVRLLSDAGALGPHFTAVHATHLTAADIADLAAAGARVSLCPTTERDLADGIGPAAALAAAGVPLTIGSDQHAVIDPFEELRGVEMHERLVTRARSRFTPAELMTMATTAGYSSLGVPHGGRLAVGAPADLVAVRDDTVTTVGSRPSQIAYTATARDVDTVMVGGRVVVDGGEHRLGAVAPLLARALAGVGVGP